MRNVYLHTPPVELNPDQTMYPHPAIALSEGLAELGFSLFAPRPYWRTSPLNDDTLFKFDPHVGPDECDIVLVPSDLVLFYDGMKLIRSFQRNPSQVRVYMHQHDHSTLDEWRLRTVFAKKFDLVLAMHRTVHQRLPANVKPWAFGLTHRQIRELIDVPPFSKRHRTLRWNFRHAGVHTVRQVAQDRCQRMFEAVLPSSSSEPSIPEQPYHKLMWRQTGRRHNPSFYDELKSVAATATFSGWFIPPWPRDQASVMFLLMWRAMRLLNLTSNRISQWDNWRFWEAMAAGSVSIHVDFDRYGMALPVQPLNWEHYIGINLERPGDAVERILAEPQLLERISAKGRVWASEHYSPVAVARRFLGLLGVEQPGLGGGRVAAS